MKRIIAGYITIIVLALSMLSGCSLEKTCKAPDCNETDIYEDGYCKYHYQKNLMMDVLKEGENTLRDFVNGN